MPPRYTFDGFGGQSGRVTPGLRGERDHRSKTPTYQHTKAILRAECERVPSSAVLQNTTINRALDPVFEEGALYSESEITESEITDDDPDDEHGTTTHMSPARPVLRKRQAHREEIVDVPHILQASVRPAPASVRSSPAPASASLASRTRGRAASYNADDHSEYASMEGISTRSRPSFTAHNQLPTVQENEPLLDAPANLYVPSAPLPPKIPSRRRYGMPEELTGVSSHSTEGPSRSRTPSVTTLGSRAPSVAPSASRAPSIAPSASRAPSIAPSASRAPSIAPSASRAPSIAPSASRAPSGNPFVSRAHSVAPSSSSARSEVLPPKSASSIRSQSQGMSMSPHPSMFSSAITPAELAATYVRFTHRRALPKKGARLEDGTENDNASQPAERIVTAWFESRSDALLECPPDLRLHPELHYGDIFYHRTATRYQLWCWTLGSNNEEFWDEAYWGYERSGLFLTLTGILQRPSWVSQRRLATREREIEMSVADSLPQDEQMKMEE
ncbi:hypothetical protein GSI_10047 [Ganoderma sinense ZZ0214-1]|uniref:Uncharacterized protein n=1 Tax=Ganoderma sinense ZZ0214-1 TaxID=1077348 RepID=A0A2G8RZG2_9APHY|nr:hypothetical protein GSI_10047 [Ganoderma sinense ZZ0214-1]